MNFDWNNPYPTIRSPLMARNVVSTSHPLSSQAGARMLLKGGNAVDAAIAAAAALTIVEPISNGLGSDCFAILWDGSRLHGLNSSGPAPATWTPDYFARKHGGQVPVRGWDAVTVPGAVAGWVELSRRFGKLPFADLMQPAIELAERGHGIGVIVSDKWARQVPQLQDQPGFAETFMPRGRAPATGRALRVQGSRPDAAPHRRDARRGLLPRRDRRAAGAARQGQRRKHVAGRSCELQARVGRHDLEGLRRPHAARDSAQRAGHRCIDGARHAGEARHRPASRSTASSRSTCRSRP